MPCIRWTIVQKELNFCLCSYAQSVMILIRIFFVLHNCRNKFIFQCQWLLFFQSSLFYIEQEAGDKLFKNWPLFVSFRLRGHHFLNILMHPKSYSDVLHMSDWASNKQLNTFYTHFLKNSQHFPNNVAVKICIDNI